MESLESNSVKTETLDGDNKYKCGRCRAYVAAEKGAKIHVSPNVWWRLGGARWERE